MLAEAPTEAEPTTGAEIANYSGADRQRILEEGARKEGELLLYTTGTQIAPLMNRFAQKYPYLKLKSYRAGSSEVAQRVTIEYRQPRPMRPRYGFGPDRGGVDHRRGRAHRTGLGEVTVRPIANAKQQPEILDREAGRSTLDWLARLSRPLGTVFEPRGEAVAPVAVQPEPMLRAMAGS